MQERVLLLLDEREEDEEDDSDNENVVDRDTEKLADDVVALIDMLCVLVLPGEKFDDALELVILLLELTIGTLAVFEEEACCDDKVRDVEDVVEGPELCFVLDVILFIPEEDFLDEL